MSFPAFSVEHEESHNHENSNTSISSKKAIYTCPMHPQIRSEEPGTCPICGMDLVPLASNDAKNTTNDDDEDNILITKASRRLAGIETEKVSKISASQSIKAIGSISFDEGRISTISAYVDGRIEKLYADYTGVTVKKGEHLAEFYSPNLYSAQVEFLQASEALWNMKDASSSVLRTQKQLLKGAETKLKELGMNNTQISKLKKTRKALTRLTLNSTVNGTVIEKNTTQGSYVKTGQVIYRVADLSTVWLLLDLFPEETTYLKFGLKVTARIRSAPDREFVGRISFIDPIINSQSRTVRVRVEIPNPDGILKPGDYADAQIEVLLGTKGGRSKIYDPELAGKYISPMHPQIISDKPGKCPICGMTMVPAEEFGYTGNQSEMEQVIAVPRDAVLSIGKKSVIFVEAKENFFTLREVTVGHVTTSNNIVIINGLQDGETIATSGVFLIDSQMQLSGKTSLMQVTTGKKAKADVEHDHH